MAVSLDTVTVFCPFRTIGRCETAVHDAVELRSVVDCKLNPATLVGQLNITLPATVVIDNCGAATGSEMLNIVP